MTGKTVKKRSTKKLKGKNTVIQRNELVEAKITSDALTTQENRILYTIASTIDSKTETFDTIKIDAKELSEFLGINYTNNHTHLRRSCENLRKKEVQIETKERSISTGWITSAELIKGEGIIEFFFHPKIKFFLTNIKKGDHYTSFKIGEFLDLKTKHGQSMYQLMMKWKNNKNNKFVYDLKIFRNIMGASSKAYDLYSNLKRKVITPAIDDIEKNTNWKLSYKEIKDGKKVVGFEFTIDEKPSNKKKEPFDNKGVVIQKLNKEKEAKNFVDSISTI